MIAETVIVYDTSFRQYDSNEGHVKVVNGFLRRACISYGHVSVLLLLSFIVVLPYTVSLR